MSDQQKKEIVSDATHRAKAAVEDARDKVKDYLAELNEIQEKLVQARQHHETPDRDQIEGLESRLKQIQAEMTASVEDAGKEVAEATHNAKTKLGLGEGTDANTGQRGLAESGRPGGGFGGAAASAPIGGSDHAKDLETEGSGDTPTSARASQGIVGGFMFRPSTTSDKEGDDDDSEGDEGPTADDVTASMDEATASAKAASQTNKAAVEEAAEDVRGQLQKQHVS